MHMMRAIVLEAFGAADHFKMKQVELPQPKKGEVRIRVKAVGFNPVDCKARQGMFGGKPPLILGVDWSGVIDAVGEDGKGFAVGDEVYGMALGQSSNGSYAESLCLPIEFVAKKPKKLNFEQAAAVPIVALTAYRAMIASLALKKGDTIFIAGAGGGVGSMAIEMAKFAGVKTIFSVAGSEASIDFLTEQLGLKKENILLYRNLTGEQMEQKLTAMNGNRLFDATFDFVGGEMKRLCLKLTGYSAHFASIVPENQPFDFPVWERGKSLCFNRNLSLHFIFTSAESHSATTDLWSIYSRHLNQITTLFENGNLRPPPVKNLGQLSVETVIEAHRLLEEGKVKGKLIMQVL
ncbi:MAG: NADP-dependent oxidoreductase [Rhabdochlamydiaceae bacterium]